MEVNKQNGSMSFARYRSRRTIAIGNGTPRVRFSHSKNRRRMLVGGYVIGLLQPCWYGTAGHWAFVSKRMRGCRVSRIWLKTETFLDPFEPKHWNKHRHSTGSNKREPSFDGENWLRGENN